MKQYKTQGIILKRQNFMETDKLLTIYSYDFGQIKVIAKGVRKILSKLSGHLELFYLTNFVITEGKNIDIITSAQMKERFANIRNAKNTIYAAYYIAELIYKATPEKYQNKNIFNLLVEVLNKINEKNYLKIINYFELKIFCEMGHGPEVEKCVICGKILEEKSHLFDYQEGGIVCLKCDKKNIGQFNIGPGMIKLLRLIKKYDLNFLSKINLSRDNVSKLQQCIQAIRFDVLGKDLKSASFL